MNLYVYAMNSPLMFTDPDGLMARDAWDYTKDPGINSSGATIVMKSLGSEPGLR